MSILIFIRFSTGHGESGPKDLAQMSFFEFLKSPMGHALYQMLSLDTQPEQEDWETHKQWWDDNLKKLQTKLNKRGVFDEYHEFVAWRTQLFMSKFWDLAAKVSINFKWNSHAFLTKFNNFLGYHQLDD